MKIKCAVKSPILNLLNSVYIFTKPKNENNQITIQELRPFYNLFILQESKVLAVTEL